MQNPELIGTLSAFDRSSGDHYSRTICVTSLEGFEKAMREFEEIVPFRKYYLDFESDTPLHESLEEKISEILEL